MPGAHITMLHYCDGTFQRSCDASHSHAMFCDANSDMFNSLLLILESFCDLLSKILKRLKHSNGHSILFYLFIYSEMS